MTDGGGMGGMDLEELNAVATVPNKQCLFVAETRGT